MASSRDRAELRAVSDAVLAVTAHRSVSDVLQTIVVAARRLLGARYAALGIPDGNGSFAQFLVDGISDAQWAAIGPLPRQHGLLGFLLTEPRAIRLADIRAHPRFEGWPAAHPILTDFLGMPIVEDQQVLGGLYLANKKAAGGFTEADEELLGLLAAHAAIALVNARLYEHNRELSIVAERNRIAHELHDAVTQKLFSLRLTAGAAAALVAADPQRAAAELATVQRLASEVSDELRTIVVGLHPVDLRGDGLELALRKQAELLDRIHPATIRFRARRLPRLSPATQEAAYRIAQEALHNALRHADAEQIDVELATRGGGLRLTVRDNGRGFATAVPDAAGRRLGLSSMRERAQAAGGRLQVRSTPGTGTTIQLEVPAGG